MQMETYFYGVHGCELWIRHGKLKNSIFSNLNVNKRLANIHVLANMLVSFGTFTLIVTRSS